MNAIFKLLGYLGVVIFIVGVAYANGEQLVDVTYFPGRTVVDVPVFIVILGSVFIGVLVAGILAVLEHFKHGARERDLKRTIASLKDEVEQLRRTPDRGGLISGVDAAVGSGRAGSSYDDALDEGVPRAGDGAAGRDEE